jgi:hypothetical protein
MLNWSEEIDAAEFAGAREKVGRDTGAEQVGAFLLEPVEVGGVRASGPLRACRAG